MPEQTRLFIGNLPAGTSETDISKEFSYYGKVNNVEIKQKKGVEDESSFAFVSMESDIQNINKCIEEFSGHEWKGCFLNVSIARESFMEKLKRERAEEERKKKNLDQPPISSNLTVNIKKPIINNDIPKAKLPIKSSNKYNDYTRCEVTAQSVNSQSPTAETQFINDELVSSLIIKNNKFKAFNTSKKLIIESVNGDVAIPANNQNKPPVKMTVADEKRLKSIQNMRSSYNEKKSQINLALSSVDKKSNKKILFDDHGSAIQENNELGKKNVNNKNKRKENGEAVSGKLQQSKKHKTTLFDEESESEDDINFDIKQQFQGQSGQKLLELQARYKSDKRFVLDERFIEDDEGNGPHGVTKNDDDEIEAAEDDEKNRQFEILQGILGTTVRRSKMAMVNSEDPSGKKLLPLKTMLRYDPSRPDHDKFMNKTFENSEILPKKSKKQRQKERLLALDEKNKTEEKPAPEVSKERYYTVNESLKQSMEEQKPFSLLSMFGTKDVDENAAQNKGDDGLEYKSQRLIKSKKNPLDSTEKNPFFYDTSDSEDDNKNVNSEENVLQTCVLPGGQAEIKAFTTTENFFFASNDERFKEALNFFMDLKQRSERTREEVKNVVKKRIRNNLRNDKSHFKKVSRHPPNSKQFKKR